MVRFLKGVAELNSIFSVLKPIGLALIFLLLNFGLRYDPNRIRLADLENIRNAIELYKIEHGNYPIAEYSQPVDENDTTWIPGLVPRYLDELPVDPMNSNEVSHQYLYHSDGFDYKIIAHGADDVFYNAIEYPNIIDPIRPVFAYGYWSKNGEDF